MEWIWKCRQQTNGCFHCNDVTISARACQITCVSIVCSAVCSGVDQRKRQSSASLAFVRGIHRPPVDSPYKGQQRGKTSIWWRYRVCRHQYLTISHVIDYFTCKGCVTISFTSDDFPANTNIGNYDSQWASYQISKIAGCACAGNAGNVFPRRQF